MLMLMLMRGWEVLGGGRLYRYYGGKDGRRDAIMPCQSANYLAIFYVKYFNSDAPPVIFIIFLCHSIGAAAEN